MKRFYVISEPMSPAIPTISSFFIADFSMSLYKYSINFQFSEKVCMLIPLVYLLQGGGVSNSAYIIFFFTFRFLAPRYSLCQ